MILNACFYHVSRRLGLYSDPKNTDQKNKNTTQPPSTHPLQHQYWKTPKKSTWHHLHAALSHARNGNESQAKLHASIALQAMQQSEDYLDENEHLDFSNQIQDMLSK